MAKPLLEHVLANWATLVEGFQTSSLEFYTAVETALRRREVPGIRFSRIDYQESGALSANREYLRVSRHHLFFDICAAPFGTGFFFSWWQVAPPLRFGVVFGFLLLAFEFLVWYFAMHSLPRGRFFFGLLVLWGAPRIIVALLIALIAFWLLCAIARSVWWLEDFLLPIPIAGFIYKHWFRTTTYYELDTIAMYRTSVHAAVQEVIDGLTNAKGVRALSPEERKPILRELYQR